MRWRTSAVVLLVAVEAATAGGLSSLAEQRQWRSILDVAAVRSRQVPLSSGEALVVAYAASVLDDPRQVEYLRLAVADDGPGQVARIRLAAVVAADNPERAVELALPLARQGLSREIRDEAVEVVRRAVEAEASGSARRSVRNGLSRLRRRYRRLLRAVLASTAGPDGRRDLGAVLVESTGDRAGILAAGSLESLGPATPKERWLLAQAYFDQGLYDDAAAHLGVLEGDGSGGPPWEVAFLLGRCAFRGGRWQDAARWYRVSLQRARGSERRADLLVHLARTVELAGDGGAALDAARRAVAERPSDGRRLFLARLELTNGDVAAAERNVTQCRAAANRDRGRVLLALDDLRDGRIDEALAELGRLRSAAWAPVGGVLAAEILNERDEFERALTALRSAVRDGLGPFWELHASRIARRLPEPVMQQWRRDVARARAQASPSEELRLLAESVVLEPDATNRVRIRSEVAERLVPAGGAPPVPTGGLAGALWSLGLRREAADWDPRGFGRDGAPRAAWSSVMLNRLGATDRAMVLADEVRRRLLGRGPVAMLPRAVLEALYPLPLEKETRSAAEQTGVPWELLAALVREESRWEVDAVSAVGARGLTQMMPATARRVARAAGEPLPAVESLFVPETALRLGGLELARLLATFDGRVEAAVAAYNAGESPVRLWRSACPSPCGSDLFVATVGYSATRLYVADVLASAEWYRELYGADGSSSAGAQSR